MKLKIIAIVMVLCLIPQLSFAGFDWLKKKAKEMKESSLDSVLSSDNASDTSSTQSLTDIKLSETKIGAGLKEALKIGINNTIEAASQKNSYLNNENIKIMLPERLKLLDSGLRRLGYGEKVDEFILSMNRSAEKAAPYARDIFLDALLDMSIDDAKKLYAASDTAATEYFKDKTYKKLQEAFKPSVEATIKEFDVTRKYSDITDKYNKIPFTKKLPDISIDNYVIKETLDGLYYLLGQEETKIRNNPAARVTDLLKKVFKK